MEREMANAAQPGADAPDREELLGRLLRSVNDVVWCATTDGSRLLFVNDAAQRVYGRPLNDLISRPQHLGAARPHECYLRACCR